MNIYNTETSVVFCKTKEKWGDFSNMCSGYGFEHNNVYWPTSEHWYQAQYFVHKSELMEELRLIKSPMAAKMFRKKNKQFQDPEWESKRVKIMIQAVKMKFEAHEEKLTKLLLESGDKDIVEKSYKDKFWGAVPTKTQNVLEGDNQLGKIWMCLRSNINLNGESWKDFFI